MSNQRVGELKVGQTFKTWTNRVVTITWIGRSRKESGWYRVQFEELGHTSEVSYKASDYVEVIDT